eukprot:1339107-Prymnesium_polylepis.1
MADARASISNSACLNACRSPSASRCMRDSLARCASRVCSTRISCARISSPAAATCAASLAA